MTDRKSTIIAFLMILGMFLIVLITVKIASASPTLDTTTPRVSPVSVQALQQPSPKEASDIPMLHTTISDDTLQPAYGNVQGAQVPTTN